MGKKTQYGFRIGADLIGKTIAQQVTSVPDNKTLMALPLNAEPESSFEPHQLKTIDEIFEKFDPNITVEIATSEGEDEDVTLHFAKLQDFSKDAITERTPQLQKMKEEQTVYSKFADVLRNNNDLRAILADTEQKEALISVLGNLIEELEASL